MSLDIEHSDILNTPLVTNDATDARAAAYCRARLDRDALGDVLAALGLDGAA